MPLELADDAIRLRAPCHGDVDRAVEAVRRSTKELMLWTSWCHADFAAADVTKFLRKAEDERFEDRAYDFYIFDASQKRILGGCGLYHVDRSINAASLGYWVRSDAAGQGIATRAARLMVRHGFAELDLARIEILVAVENRGSQRVAEKIVRRARRGLAPALEGVGRACRCRGLLSAAQRSRLTDAFGRRPAFRLRLRHEVPAHQ